MKKLTNVVSKVVDGKLTVTADVTECAAGDYRFPVQQVSIGYLSDKNHQWPRHIQLSGEATFVKAFGNGMAINHDDLVSIAAVVEPKTSFPPVFKKRIPDYTVEIDTELDPDFQWQVSDSIDTKQSWKDIAGQTTKTLDKSTVPPGKWVRCVASSEAGSMTSNPVIVK